MRIALIAPVVERTPPHRYGGTERVVANLADGLVDRGHQVTLFATGDSRTRAELVPSVTTALWHDLDFDGDPSWPLTAQLGRVLARQHEFDIIHNHTDFSFFPLAAALEVLSLTTLHGRLDMPAYREMLGQFPYVPLVSISDSQRHGTDGLGLNWVATVYHGLKPHRFTYSEKHGDYLVFLGRMAPEKGPDAAIRVAQQVGMPIRLAAKIPEPNRDYFDNVIRPLLKLPGVEFIGEVNEEQKNELLMDAWALLFPADWPEPFGLALIEAMAAGTPVVALRRGSIPEIIDDGVTGFICDTVGEMPQACMKVNELSRAASRDRFEAQFTVDRMVERYLDVYARVLAAEPLPREVFMKSLALRPAPEG